MLKETDHSLDSFSIVWDIDLSISLRTVVNIIFTF